MKKQYLQSNSILKSVLDEEKQIVHVVASTGNEDRHKDTVNPKGWDLKNFEKNPVILVSHDYSSLPVGKAIKTWMEDDALHMHIEIAQTEKGKELFYLVKNGFLNTVSVGFIAKEYGKMKGDFTIMKQELLEVSFVAVPANPDALVQNDVAKEKLDLLTKSIEDEARKKDVGQAYTLANIADYLDWTIYSFTQQEVKESVVQKITQALTLVLEALQEEAVLGEKTITQRELIDKSVSDIVEKHKVIEEKQVEVIKYVDGVQLSDNAATLLMQIKKSTEKTSKKTDATAQLLKALLNGKTQGEGGEK